MTSWLENTNPELVIKMDRPRRIGHHAKRAARAGVHATDALIVMAGGYLLTLITLAWMGS